MSYSPQVNAAINRIRMYHATERAVLDQYRNYRTPGPSLIELYATAPWELYYVKIIAWN